MAQLQPGFVSAADYLKAMERDKPCSSSLLTLATHHALFSGKRMVRSMVDITAAYHLRKNMTKRNLQAVT